MEVQPNNYTVHLRTVVRIQVNGVKATDPSTAMFLAGDAINLDTLLHNHRPRQQPNLSGAWIESVSYDDSGIDGATVDALDEHGAQLDTVNLDAQGREDGFPGDSTKATPATKVLRKVFIEAYANDDHADGPEWIELHSPAEWLERIQGLQKLVRENGLTEARVSLSPDVWGPQGVDSDLRFKCPELVVSNDAFHFTTLVTHHDYTCQSRFCDIASLVETVAADAGPIALMSDDSEGLAECIVSMLDSQTDLTAVAGWVAQRHARPFDEEPSSRQLEWIDSYLVAHEG